MTNFILDHLFCFCDPHLSSEIENATKAGLTIHPGNRHPGQGTANRAILFKENYLEFIFMDSSDDAQKNPLRLDKRANWSKTGASPFGICLRGEISQKESNEFWAYHPSYWPDGVIYIHKSNEDTPEQPMIFVIPSSTRPIDKPNINATFLTHKTQSEAIRTVNIFGPQYKWPNISSLKNIIFSEATDLQMKVSVDGNIPNEIVLNDLLSINGIAAAYE